MIFGSEIEAVGIEKIKIENEFEAVRIGGKKEIKENDFWK